MTTTTKEILRRDYNLIGILDNEADMLDSLSEHSGYVCDVISEVADSYIPIYNHSVWENASALQDYIEDAISEGIAGVEGGDIDLVKIFQAGYYVYYQQSLYDNLDTIAFNMVVDKVNEYLAEQDTVENLDLDGIENTIESETENFDNNNQMDSIDDIFNSIVEQIKNDEFEM